LRACWIHQVAALAGAMAAAASSPRWPWWRLLAVLEVTWERATTGEVTVLVGWLRTARNPQRRRSSGVRPGTVNLRTGKAALPEGYSPSTINHIMSALSGFYAFHAHYGRGPAVNPVPDQPGRRALLGHRSPLEPHQLARRARLRQKVADRCPAGPGQASSSICAWSTSTGRASGFGWSRRARGCCRRPRPRRSPSATWPPTSTSTGYQSRSSRSGGPCTGGRGR